MATRTKKAKNTTARTKTRSTRVGSSTITVTLTLPIKRLLRLGADANRAAMTIADYLLACELEFGHNLWTRPTGTKVGGTD